MKRLRQFFRWLKATRLRRWIFIYVPAVFILFTVYCNILIEHVASGKLFTTIESLPEKKTALVFGTSPWSRGHDNLFYVYRMRAAADLWKAGKVKHIIVSGDNSTMNYDEATAMKKSLIGFGVPDSAITLDYAGFRTLDSVVRCKWVFGQDDIIVVSQEFQNERAIFIAQHFGISAVGYNAEDVDPRFHIRTFIREYFARVKAVLDIYLLGTKPKFPGPPEPIR